MYNVADRERPLDFHAAGVFDLFGREFLSSGGTCLRALRLEYNGLSLRFRSERANS